MPSVASSVLNHAVTRLEKDLNPVVQFEIHFATHDDIEIHRISGMHTRMIPFHDINHPRQLLLDFFKR